MYPTDAKYDHPSILLEDEHDVQLLPFHLDLDAFGAMGWWLYSDIVL
jgi:hypothetical protein